MNKLLKTYTIEILLFLMIVAMTIIVVYPNLHTLSLIGLARFTGIIASILLFVISVYKFTWRSSNKINQSALVVFSLLFALALFLR